MDKGEIFKLVQEWTNQVPLLIVGSGASIPFGLPSMSELGEYLKNIGPFPDPRDDAQFEQFRALLDKNKDLEITLQEIMISENVLERIVSKTWELVNGRDLLAYEDIINKRIEFPFAKLTKHLLQTTDRTLSVITTNYDRLAEYAAALAGAFICNGYVQNSIGQFSPAAIENNFAGLKGYNGRVNIWKVHGSLDWFRDTERADIHLPLRNSIPKNFAPAIVTPGFHKYKDTHYEPYRTISGQADQEIDRANGFLCIGYGFNDSHVQPRLIAQIKDKKPIIVVAKKLTDNTKREIIGGGCKNYLLIEEDINPANTKIYSSNGGEMLIDDESFWRLDKYLTIIKE